LTVIDLDGLGVLGRSLGDGVVGAASSSGDGRRIAARAVDGFDVEVTDQVSGATRRVNGSTNVPATPIMSPDGGIVALRTAYEVEFVDVVTNRVLGDRITNVGSLPEFSPDGSLVAIPSLVGVVVLRVPSLDVVAAVAPQAPGDLVTDLAWSPDGSQLALTGKRARTRIVDATTGTVVLGDVGLEVGSQLRWSSDGTRIAVIVAGASSRIIDARTGASIRELPSVRGPIELAGWTREDQRFVVVRAAEPDDLVVEFIDTSTGRRVGPSTPITELRSFVSGQITDDELLVFSPGQPAVAITTDPSEWARIACEVAGRDLTSAEWATYLGDMDGWRSTCPAST
jgi:WD40 repeat protein